MKNFTWNHLPCAGGFYDQDEDILRVWECIRHCFIDTTKNENIQKALDDKRAREEKLKKKG